MATDQVYHICWIREAVEKEVEIDLKEGVP